MNLVVIGGSDAGISAALRSRELDPAIDVTVVVADAYPNFSICGIPYYVSGEVGHWRNLAHRSKADLQATGMKLRLNTTATEIDTERRRILLRERDGSTSSLDYDELVVGTGATPVRPAIAGLDELGQKDGLHLLHTMGDTHALITTLDASDVPGHALIVGAGYVGLEMAEALTARGGLVTQVEMLPEVLPTVDPELGAIVRGELTRHGVAVHTATTVTGIHPGKHGRSCLRVSADGPDGDLAWEVDVVLVVVGVRPETRLLLDAGAQPGPRGAIVVDDSMATGLPHVWAAGDCVATHHRLLGLSYLPLGTTAHKQGRIAGENALGGDARFAGSLGTQVVKVFDLVAARTGLRNHEALQVGFSAATSLSKANDHKAYYPGAQPITMSVTGDIDTGRLLGAQLVGARGTETAKRVDTFAAALFHGMTVDAINELDLSYTPPLGSPWDAVQLAAQQWVSEHQPAATPRPDPNGEPRTKQRQTPRTPNRPISTPRQG